MKSHINILVDYKETPFEKEVAIRCPEEHIQNQMKHLTRGFKKTEDVKILEKGDVSVLSLESEIKKFNKPSVFITVGGGLFDKEFEEKLPGRTVGETFEVKVGDKPVKVTVKQASRTVYPEPTDEMAAAYAKEHDEYAGITTVEEYRRRIVDTYCEEQRREAVFRVMDAVLDYVLTHSDWEFDEEEIARLSSEEKEFLRNQLKKEENKDFDNLTGEELQRYFEVGSYEEMDQFIKNGAEQRIAMLLWKASIEGKDTKESSIEELEEALVSWDFLENFAEKSLNIKEEK